jgi:hypothetical protein
MTEGYHDMTGDLARDGTRGTGQEVIEVIQHFDAMIDLPIEMWPNHLTPREAVSLVGRAVEAMPGAGWI